MISPVQSSPMIREGSSREPGVWEGFVENVGF